MSRYRYIQDSKKLDNWGDTRDFPQITCIQAQMDQRRLGQRQKRQDKPLLEQLYDLSPRETRDSIEMSLSSPNELIQQGKYKSPFSNPNKDTIQEFHQKCSPCLGTIAHVQIDLSIVSQKLLKELLIPASQRLQRGTVCPLEGCILHSMLSRLVCLCLERALSWMLANVPQMHVQASVDQSDVHNCQLLVSAFLAGAVHLIDTHLVTVRT
jgi:hypothetical protein